MPCIKARKFGYADYEAIATQHKSSDITEDVHTSTSYILDKDFFVNRSYNLIQLRWKYHAPIFVTEQWVNSLMYNLREININTTYILNIFGVTLNSTVSYREHLMNTAAKLKSRNNILHK